MPPHNFKDFPELSNGQMDEFYFSSPHKQILEDFTAKVIKVHDGDTMTVRWSERDFDFPVRLAFINAPELNETGGHSSRDWMKSRVEGKEVDILIDPNNRVGRFGRIIGDVIEGGISVNRESLDNGKSLNFGVLSFEQEMLKMRLDK